MKRVIYTLAVFSLIIGVLGLVVPSVNAGTERRWLHHESQGVGDPSWTECRPTEAWNGHHRHNGDWQGDICGVEPTPVPPTVVPPTVVPPTQAPTTVPTDVPDPTATPEETKPPEPTDIPTQVPTIVVTDPPPTATSTKQPTPTSTVTVPPTIVVTPIVTPTATIVFTPTATSTKQPTPTSTATIPVTSTTVARTPVSTPQGSPPEFMPVTGGSNPWEDFGIIMVVVGLVLLVIARKLKQT